MAAPTNISAATATAISVLPCTITLDVTEAPNYQTVWYAFTAPSTGVISAFPWTESDTSEYKPQISVWVGDPASVTKYLSFNPMTMKPIVIPVTEDTTYYIAVANEVVTTPSSAILTLTCEDGPNEAVPAGALFINDDTEGYPAAILDPTDGHVLRYIHPFPHGEMGDVLPSGILLYKSDDREKVAIYNADLSLNQEVAVFPAHEEDGDTYIDGESSWYPQIRGDDQHTFYLLNTDAYWGTVTVKTISDTGVVGGTSWTLPSTATHGGMTPSPDGTILYYGRYDPNIYRYDLVNLTALSNLVTSGLTGYRAAQKDLLCLADGSLIVTFNKVSSPYGGLIRHYAADGTQLAEWDMSGTTTYGVGGVWFLNRIAKDLTDDSFWVWRYGITTAGVRLGVSRYDRIQVSDGATLASFTLDEFNQGVGPGGDPEPVKWGPSNSCPMIVLRQGIAPVSEDPEATFAGSFSASGTVTWQGIAPSTVRHCEIRRLRQSPHLSQEQVTLFFDSFQLDVEAGVGLSEGQGVDPQIMLQWSDDGGHTWSNEHWVSAGKQGAYQWRAIWRRLGRGRDRVWRVVMSDPVKWVILDGIVNASKGTA